LILGIVPYLEMYNFIPARLLAPAVPRASNAR
jgi:hypothetical protein